MGKHCCFWGTQTGQINIITNMLLNDFQCVKMFLVKLMNTMKMLQVLQGMIRNHFIEMNILRDKDRKIGREMRNDILTRRR